MFLRWECTTSFFFSRSLWCVCGLHDGDDGLIRRGVSREIRHTAVNHSICTNLTSAMMMVMAIGNYFDDDDLHNDPKINSHDISILYSYGSNLHIC